ncbi:phosphatidylinositol kinase [Stenotrophomonas ginsengisoli]|uniref:Phosphatidylinositol kinase n=1 Tax=Stenotrophomonas ginsengisoli TaxID=336566 RepID=A0A0R0DHK7_9GAMM|nr:type II toxin-antitoxin system HipA family toxin [Stenotrophomonas ginsengisoli]KRG76963.1 phosphatidylinositol kinase [Stenotrophomonas ginsengisoli]
MAGFKRVDVIEVRCWGEQVGAIAADPVAGAYVFQYSPAWIKRHIQLAPLTMSIQPGGPDKWLFPGLSAETYRRLPGMLADALPDKFGNALIDAWMSARGIRPDQITPLDRLVYMGKRGMGALEFRPARSGAGRTSAAPLRIAKMVEQARKVLDGSILDDQAAAESLSHIISVGTSAGGTRAKAVVGWNPATEGLVSGQFDLPDGYEHWLLKFDGVGAGSQLGPDRHVGRTEFAYHLMATAAGINMQPCRLLEENGRAHFMTKRFDRCGNAKVHMQTLCGIGHYDFNLRQTNAYEQLFLTIKGLGLPDAVFTEAFRRMAFNVAARNNDDHTKNFSFILPEGGSWSLSPAYDVTFACTPGHVWHGEHLMSVNGKTSDITREDLLTIADRFSIPGAINALVQVNAAIACWDEFAAQAAIPEQSAEHIKVLLLPV